MPTLTKPTPPTPPQVIVPTESPAPLTLPVISDG